MDLILIRHGRPERIDFDADGANPALTELGHRQAARMAEYLAPEPIDALYVSPQQRAIDTAAPLAETSGLTPTVVDGIAEFDLGHTSYVPGEEMGPMTAEELDDLIAQLTADSFVGRVMNAVDTIIADHQGETVAAVCHGGVISTGAREHARPRRDAVLRFAIHLGDPHPRIEVGPSKRVLVQ